MSNSYNVGSGNMVDAIKESVEGRLGIGEVVLLLLSLLEILRVIIVELGNVDFSDETSELLRLEGIVLDVQRRTN